MVFSTTTIFFFCVWIEIGYYYHHIIGVVHHICKTCKASFFIFDHFRVYTRQIYIVRISYKTIYYILNRKNTFYFNSADIRKIRRKKKRVNLTSNWLCVGASDVIFSFAYNHESESVALF